MDFKVLGPVRASAEGEPVSVGGAKPRALLAALLTQPGKAVQPDRLSDAIWGDSPPSSARGLVHTYVSGLRRSFAATGEHNPLTRDGTGYRLQVEPEQLDATRFEQLVAQARRHTAERRPELARQVYAQALALWDGPAFGGLANGCLQPEAQRLEELRLTALEERIAADLACGNDATLVAELRTLVHEHPLREQLWASLMIALYRQGRRGEALNTFQRADRLLRSELGIAPGDELRELQRAMLNDEPVVPRGAVEAPINQLPAACRALYGREESAHQVMDSLRPGREATPAITVLSGAPGVGKTALAIDVAQRLRPQFPDGVLYADMHGYRGETGRTAAEVLTGWLRALGVPAEELPGDEPPDVDVLSALFRDRMEARRLLVVLDDVRSADQVRPLLPGSARCSVLVLSRNALSGLVASHGAHRVRLDVLSPEAAGQLAAHGLDEVAQDALPDEAAEVAQLCGYLPLAIRTATARTSSGLAGQLRALPGAERLDALEIAGDEPTGVRPSIERSYRVLDEDVRRVFGLLPSLDGPEFDSASVSDAADVPETAARRALDALAEENLIRRVPGGGYTMDELIRLYAESLGTAECSFDGWPEATFDPARTAPARNRPLSRSGRTHPSRRPTARRAAHSPWRTEQPNSVIPNARAPDPTEIP